MSSYFLRFLFSYKKYLIALYCQPYPNVNENLPPHPWCGHLLFPVGCTDGNYAKKYESVLLAVHPNGGCRCLLTALVWAFGADVYYLFDQDSIYYYEIFMGDENVKIILAYSTVFPFGVKFQTFLLNGEVTANVKNCSTGKEAFLYLTPDSGYRPDDICIKTEKGDTLLDLNCVGEEEGAMV